MQQLYRVVSKILSTIQTTPTFNCSWVISERVECRSGFVFDRVRGAVKEIKDRPDVLILVWVIAVTVLSDELYDRQLHQLIQRGEVVEQQMQILQSSV